MTGKVEVDLAFGRHSQDYLITELRAAGASFKGNACRCPFCPDEHPSAGIYRGEDGVWRFKCHKCGMNEDIIGVRAARERTSSADIIRDQRREQDPPRPAPKVYPTLDALKATFGTLEACYVYADPQTKAPQMVVLRVRDGGKKRFVQASPCPGGGFTMTAPPKPWPIYNRGRIPAADFVFVVEGEKCCHALHALGIVATTSPGGAGKAALADWSALAGKLVYLWPDNDDAGQGHMRDVQRVLERLSPPAQVWWIDPKPFELPPKGDVVQYLEMFGGDNRRRSIECAMELAAPMGGAAVLAQRIADAKAGKLKSVSWPWRGVTKLTKALLPGTVTSICADPGAGKSFFALEAFGYWHRSGVKAALHMLEDSKAYHLNRILAQLDDCANITDTDWQERNPAEIDAALAAHRAELDAIASCLDATDEPTNYDALLEWMRCRCAQGCRVLLIDPITAVPVEKPWSEDMRFIMSAKQIVSQWGASLVLMTHPRSSKKGGGSLSDIAGGAAFPRFSHSVMWLDRHDEPKRVTCDGPCGVFNTNINRTLRIGKARNGGGTGLHIGFHFGDGLKFAEQGVIKKTKAKDGVADPFADEAAA